MNINMNLYKNLDFSMSITNFINLNIDKSFNDKIIQNSKLYKIDNNTNTIFYLFYKKFYFKFYENYKQIIDNYKNENTLYNDIKLIIKTINKDVFKYIITKYLSIITKDICNFESVLYNTIFINNVINTQFETNLLVLNVIEYNIPLLNIFVEYNYNKLDILIYVLYLLSKDKLYSDITYYHDFLDKLKITKNLTLSSYQYINNNNNKEYIIQKIIKNTHFNKINKEILEYIILQNNNVKILNTYINVCILCIIRV